MEYNDPEAGTELGERTRKFVDEVVLPVEREHSGGGAVSEDVLEELREEARARDVYCPRIDEAHGGMGYDFRDVLPLFEQAGRSLLGAPAMRVAAPDEGNMHTLELVGTEEQKEEYLEPLVAGEIYRDTARVPRGLTPRYFTPPPLLSPGRRRRLGVAGPEYQY